MELTEQAADVKQAGIESQLAQKKLAADNEHHNQLKSLTSQVEMAKTEHDRNLLKAQMDGVLMTQRLNNAQYKEALTNAGRNRRLQSKEDFSLEMSKQGLNRGKQADKENIRQSEYVQDYKRGVSTKTSMDEIEAALAKSEADDKASIQKAGIEAAAGGIKGGISAYSAYNSPEAVAKREADAEKKEAAAVAQKKDEDTMISAANRN